METKDDLEEAWEPTPERMAALLEWDEGEEPESDEEPLSSYAGPLIEDLETTVVYPLDDDGAAYLSNDELRERHNAQKPDIDSLKSAVVGGVFLPKKGDYVVIERRLLCFSDHPWLDTRVYRLLDDVTFDGNLNLWDPIRHQCAKSNWKRGIGCGFVFKLPPKGRNPETCLEGGGKRRTKRAVVAEDKPPIVTTVQPVIKLDEDGNPVKRGRGRPKGVKNRDKATIEAERRARSEEKRAAKSAKLAKRRA